MSDHLDNLLNILLQAYPRIIDITVNIRVTNTLSCTETSNSITGTISQVQTNSEMIKPDPTFNNCSISELFLD